MHFRAGLLVVLVSACVPGGSRDDAGPADAGEADAGASDAGEVDAGEPDAGEPDAGAADAGESDAGFLPRDTLRVDAILYESKGLGSFPCTDPDGGLFTPSTWSLNRASSQLSWHLCDSRAFGPPQPPARAGSRVLTATEVESLEASIRAMVPAAQPRCGADGDTRLLDIVSAGTTVRYQDNNPGGCPRAGNVMVDNMWPVFDVLLDASVP